MRCLVLILLLGAAFGQEKPAAEDPSLLEPRAWKGVIEVSGKNVGIEITRGEEIQTERIEFLLLSDPPRTTIGWPRLPLRMREGNGSYELSTDVREGEGEGALTSRGERSGDLYPTVEGYVEPTKGNYRLSVHVSPQTIAVVGTVSGVVQGKFMAYRTAGQRAPFLSGFEMEGALGEEGRLIEGERTWIDRRNGVKREAKATWRIERLDAAVRGRVVDHLGRPVKAMKVLARYTNTQRLNDGLPPLLREGVTGDDGRFSIPAFHGAWSVQLVGQEREGLVLAGRAFPELVQVKFDDVPTLDLKIDVYQLAALPQPHLLRGHFQGDADAYLSYIRERAPAEVLERALDEAPAKEEARTPSDE